MRTFNYLLLISSLFIFSACKKDDTDKGRTCNPAADGIFSATINNQPWTACTFKAVYYTKNKVLSIVAIDQYSNFELRFYITLDTITQLKTYVINANEEIGLEIVEGKKNGNIYSTDLYLCDLVNPATGGSITISKLDTITRKISASFNATGFSKDQQRTITLSNGLLNDVRLDTSARTYLDNGSYIGSTINGTSWYAKGGLFAQVTSYIASPTYSFLEVRATGYPGDLGDCHPYQQSHFSDFFSADGRNMMFIIPIFRGPGTYPLETLNSSNQTMSSPHYVFQYNHHNFNNRYNPAPGSTITITAIDTTNRNLDAVFTTQAKDAAGNIFNFTSGKIKIRKWLPY